MSGTDVQAPSGWRAVPRYRRFPTIAVAVAGALDLAGCGSTVPLAEQAALGSGGTGSVSPFGA